MYRNFSRTQSKKRWQFAQEATSLVYGEFALNVKIALLPYLLYKAIVYIYCMIFIQHLGDAFKLATRLLSFIFKTKHDNRN